LGLAIMQLEMAGLVNPAHARATPDAPTSER
jgi:hypothetical protein